MAIKAVLVPADALRSAGYWEDRYASGGNSGLGSYGHLALYKEEVINNFVKKEHIESVVEFGCGDGNQLSLANYQSYIGLDVSPTAIELCKKRFAGDSTKSFMLYDPNNRNLHAELALSLDVIYHLVEDHVFESYMKNLFSAAKRFVIIYSSNVDGPQRNHERMRNFTVWVERFVTGWQLTEEIVNRYPYNPHDPRTSQSNFYIYKRQNNK